MAITCPRCTMELPDDANYCLRCGQAQREGVGSLPDYQASRTLITWEYKDLVIPLDFSVSTSGTKEWERASAIADPIIMEYVQQAAQQGWQTDEPSDFVSLQRAYRVDSKVTGMGFRFYVGSAKVRLKRATTN